MIKFFLTDDENTLQNGLHVEEKKNQYILSYPCGSSSTCSNYFADFPPGTYLIELFGASGGAKTEDWISTASSSDQNTCLYQNNITYFPGNTICQKIESSPGAGGYTSGILNLQSKTRVYIAIGGQGSYETGSSSTCSDGPKGGYNGGGDACLYQSGSASGGGATRIIVAGGGGGSDNCFKWEYSADDDGSGGAGGGLKAQGFWIAGVYHNESIATQTSGFTFGNGESARTNGSLHDSGFKDPIGANDRAGAGGGWYGGFSSHHGNGGAGGGSSFALSKNAEIPSDLIESRNSLYDEPKSEYYAFTKNSQYLIRNPIFFQGIWAGNGKAIITLISITCTHSISKLRLSFSCLFINILI